MIKVYISSLFFLILLLASCASFDSVELEVLKPSEFTFKTPVSQLAIYNNSEEQAAHIGHVNYKKYINYRPSNKREKLGSVTIPVDSANQTCLYNLYNRLNETEAYDRLLLFKEKAQPAVAPYTSAQYFKLQHVDALLVLERLRYQDDYTLIINEIYNTTAQETKVVVSSDWSIYFSQQPTQAYTFNVRDTFYWGQEDVIRAECVSQAVWENGASAAKKISPHWQRVKRYYYAGVSHIYSDVERALADNDWIKAASCWKQIYDSQSKQNKTKARMAYNMALYFEVKNDFDAALSWLKIAHEIFEDKNASYELVHSENYARTLEKRRVDRLQIDQHWSL